MDVIAPAVTGAAHPSALSLAELGALQSGGTGRAGTPPADLGQAALQVFAKMQAAWRQDAVAAQPGNVALGREAAQALHPGPAAQPLTPGQPTSIDRLAEVLGAASRFQAQIANFTLLGSVTASAGKTVNQFLRGQ